MALQEAKYPHVEVRARLSGPEGNAFVVLGLCKSASRKATPRLTDEQWVEFRDQATSGDYDHLLAICMKFFTCNFSEEEDTSEEESDAEWDEHWAKMDAEIND